MPSVSNYLFTIRYLKFSQIRYQVFYLARKRFRELVNYRYPLRIASKGRPFTAFASLPAPLSWFGKNRFEFLNRHCDFGTRINWNYLGEGKLWAYNLNYFDYLEQLDMPLEQGRRLICDFIAQSGQNQEGMEPYPISLRAVNWIKFISRYNIQDGSIDASLFTQLCILLDNIEYHLMGNHLLENGFALLWGAIYFNDRRLHDASFKILRSELEEQILPDGAHFELSPMYHMIIFHRVLDAINLLQNSTTPNKILSLLHQKASLMAGWLKKISFLDGTVPLFNDSAPGIAPTPHQLFSYADRVGVRPGDVTLRESGYRKQKTARYELVIDVGSIGPDYIPAHGHCDMLSFVLSIDEMPYLVDTGVSTYEKGHRRQYERSTAAHNTVSVDGAEQSEIWESFRVGKRAKIKLLKDSDQQISAEHNGFTHKHRRCFSMQDHAVIIEDYMLPHGKGVARFHLAPEKKATIENDKVNCGSLRLVFHNSRRTWVEEYQYAAGFNRLKNADCICVSFEGKLHTRIEIKEI